MTAGMYKRRHYTEYVEEVKTAKREGRIDDAITLLAALLKPVEAEAVSNGVAPASWYYTQLAICYRKQKNYNAEVEVLERFAAQPTVSILPEDMMTRLAKAQALTRKDTARQEPVTGVVDSPVEVAGVERVAVLDRVPVEPALSEPSLGTGGPGRRAAGWWKRLRLRARPMRA